MALRIFKGGMVNQVEREALRGSVQSADPANRFDRQRADRMKPLYVLPNDSLAEEVLIEGFRMAGEASCMVGFFSSAVLAALAPGLATFINSSEQPFRLIVSPFLSREDQGAIEDGVSAEQVTVRVLERLLITQELLEHHTLKCLSYLLRAGRLDMRVALLRNALFHPKVWLFRAGDEMIAVHGSSNMTASGIRHNFEQISVSKSWVDPTQKYIAEKLKYQFERLWDNKEDSCQVLALPDAIRSRLLKSYAGDKPPSELDYAVLNDSDKENADEVKGQVEPRRFGIPEWLKYEEGPYSHQGKAVRAWCDAGYRGTLEMATGAGKTLTSMICAYRAFEKSTPFLIVVAAPYVPLIQQWIGEIGLFGLTPTNLTTVGNAASRSRALNQVRRRLRLGLSDVEVVVTSHDTLCSSEFTAAIAEFEAKKLLIADEAHNLGRKAFIGNPPEFYEYRLALSATPVRQYDAEGTEALLGFFGPVVFSFTLEDAIGKCLVEYDYFVHPVELSAREMDDWFEVTKRIKQNTWRIKEGKPDEFLTKLLRDRRALLETAQGKLRVLEQLLDGFDRRAIRHTLIYTSDKGPEQLDEVNRILKTRGILFHQLTAEETSDREHTQSLIKAFQDGEIQVLTAKRVLDEGVNIPQISTAFILASTTVERQWVQRRGRLLRTCKEVGKTHSVIHDLLALPTGMADAMDDDARSMVRGELNRAQEFASLARNAGRPDGPLLIIDKLVKAAYL